MDALRAIEFSSCFANSVRDDRMSMSVPHEQCLEISQLLDFSHVHFPRIFNSLIVRPAELECSSPGQLPIVALKATGSLMALELEWISTSIVPEVIWRIQSWG